jgi:hypothetical protein
MYLFIAKLTRITLDTVLQKVTDIMIECNVTIHEEIPEPFMLGFLDSQIEFSFVNVVASACAV